MRTHTHAAPALSVCVLLLLPPQDKCTGLYIAAQNGHKDVAELLLERNADVNSVNGPVRWGGGGLLYFVFGCWSMCVCVYLVCVCCGGGGHGCCVLSRVLGNVYSYLMFRLCVDAKI